MRHAARRPWVRKSTERRRGKEKAHMVWILVAILVLVAAAAVFYAARERRSRRLREGFGPEYQRTMAERGDRRAAESELREREQRREKFEIRELDPEVREHYTNEWRDAQRRFVDQPGAAVGEADRPG